MFVMQFLLPSRLKGNSDFATQLQQIDQKVLEQNKKYAYILDNSINDYDKFCMYINQNEGYEYITSNELIELLEGIV